MSSRSTALPVRARALEDARQALEARLGQERGACPSRPISPSPRLAWRSRLEPSGVMRVVDVQRAEPVEADDAVELVEHARRAPRRCGRRSRRRAGGRSPGRRRAARRRRRSSISRASSSNERPSVPPAPAVSSRCSAQPSDSSSASAIDRAGALDRRVDVAAVLQRRARVQHHADARRAPRPPAARRSATVSDLSRISGSSEAQLSR